MTVTLELIIDDVLFMLIMNLYTVVLGAEWNK